MEKQERFEKISKSYILKNKDISVLKFEYEEKKEKSLTGKYSSYKLKHIEILREDLLPKSYPVKDKYNTTELRKWIENRKAPKNRKNINNLINHEIQKYKLDSKNFMNYIDISFGLSLNDSYWIVPEDEKEYKWQDYNLYKNKFSEKLSLIAFGEKGIADNSLDEIKTSPEYTTNGMLAKCWAIMDNDIYLLKKSSEHHKIEAIAEYYMGQVADIMGFNHVDYDITTYHENIVSSCKLFTNEDEGYIPLSNCLTKEEIVKRPDKLLKRIEELTGREFLEDIMVFDSLIYNEDRHLGNYGLIVNNNTGELLRPAPIFDNGNSALMLYNDLPKDSSEIFAEHRIGLSFNVLSEEFVSERHRKGLEKLKDFKFIRHPKFNLPEELLEKTEKFISQRAKFISNQLEKKLEKNLEKKTEKDITKKNRERTRIRSKSGIER